jgi:hypothetical protein
MPSVNRPNGSAVKENNMKTIKIISSFLLAASAVTFVACSSKSKKQAADEAYVAPAPVTETATAPATDQPAYLGASSSGLSL